MLEQSSSSIRVACTLVPLDGFNILLPNACIDEIFIANDIEPIKQSPDWCLGATRFKDSEILVISLEGIEKKQDLDAQAKNLIVKLKKPKEFSHLQDVGILARRVPHVLQANNYSLEVEYTPHKTHELAKSYIRIKDKQAFIPDVKRLIADYVSQC